VPAQTVSGLQSSRRLKSQHVAAIAPAMVARAMKMQRRGGVKRQAMKARGAPGWKKLSGEEVRLAKKWYADESLRLESIMRSHIANRQHMAGWKNICLGLCFGVWSCGGICFLKFQQLSTCLLRLVAGALGRPQP
jgi:hypothetical protein